VVTARLYVPVDGEEHPLKLGVEYPSRSGKMTYEGAKFEALEPPPVPVILQKLDKLAKHLPPLPDGNPYMDGGSAPKQ
jgi:hypothetical protein